MRRRNTVRDANDNITCESSGVSFWRDLLHWTDSFFPLTSNLRDPNAKKAHTLNWAAAPI